MSLITFPGSSGGGQSAISRMMVGLSGGAVSFPQSPDVSTVPFNSQILKDTGAALSLNAAGEIVAGAGVSKIRVSGSLHFNMGSSNPGLYYAGLYLNDITNGRGNGMPSVRGSNETSFVRSAFSSAIIDVSPGDKIGMFVSVGNDGNPSVSDSVETWLAVEVFA